MSSDSASAQYSVRAVERVLDILDTLQRAAGAVSLIELAEATRLPKSSTFRYLATLEARGYVDKDPVTGDYTLGLALPSQRRYYELLSANVRPLLERLRDRFGETVNLGVLDDDRILYLEIAESRQTMRLAARRGDRDAIHSTALGKAICAGLEPERVRRMIAGAAMEAKTANTIVTPDAFLAAIEQARVDGYAIDDEENEAGARCVAVAFADLRVPAGISVSAPAVRLSRDDAAQLAGVLAAEVRGLRGALDRRSGSGGAEGA